MPQVKVSEYVKEELERLKEKYDHTSYDSVIRSLMNRKIRHPEIIEEAEVETEARMESELEREIEPEVNFEREVNHENRNNH